MDSQSIVSYANIASVCVRYNLHSYSLSLLQNKPRQSIPTICYYTTSHQTNKNTLTLNIGLVLRIA